MFLLHTDIFFWDLLILLGMTVTLAVGVAGFIMKRRADGASLRFGFFGILGILGFLLIVYASFIEPQIIVTTTHPTTHPKAPPLKIAIVSDPHIGPYKGKAFLERIADRTNALLPDIVLLPGDFIWTRSADITELTPLGSIRAPLGVYAVLGNHDVGEYQSLAGVRYSGTDRGEKIAAQLKNLGIKVLRNEFVTHPLHDGSVSIAGIDDLWTGHFDLATALDGIPATSFSILLSHNPSVINEPQSRSADLVIAGHTHGGQIRLPGFGSITDLPTSLGKKYDQGMFAIDDTTTLAITRGVGESSPRARLFAWPEVMLLRVNGKGKEAKLKS